MSTENKNSLELKYGCNPNQKPSRIFMQQGELPIEVLDGRPGYINFMDAFNSWQLVKELKEATGLPAAASFKHVSPAGAAVGIEMSDTLKKIYFVDDLPLTPLATAYARARGADRMSSYGDFIALSDTCDEATARLINREVSDGVIAPGYTPEALEILKNKRKGTYNVIKIDPSYKPAPIEHKDVFGITFEQGRNEIKLDESLLTNIPTQNKEFSEAAKRDLIIALITLKYTQSNSVCYVKDGQAIGIGAGQQSRIHCTRLAGNKADIWFLRQHPKVMNLPWIEKIRRADRDNTIDVYISGRVKSINSIYRKTYMQGKTMDQIFDIFAVRVIVDTVSDCYNVLGVVHDIFKPIPNRFKDYISMPKPNMYQSLHTTVLDKNAIPFEIQIRTWEMHYTAEYGIAAHWKYKLGMGAGGKNNDKMEENIKKVKDMILDQLEAEDVTDIAKNIRNDFTENDVYVFSPRGDVFNLPQGSTPIDMAYLIHTQVGHRMVGAKINGKIVPIDYKLKTGDICEIITQKEEHPNRGWVDICKTASAKSKIRSWYKHEKRDENIAEGRQMLDKEFKRHGINLSEEEYPDFLQKLMIKKQYNSMDDFYAAVGYGGIQLWKIMPRLKEEYQKAYASDIEEIDVPQAPVKRPKASAGVVIEGADDVLVKFSKCCNPLPGDDIIGYITRGYGVSIHKRHCTNVPKDISKSEEPERWVSCYWEDEVGEAFRSTLQITATDRTGLLADVTIKLSDMHIFIHSLNSREAGNGTAVVTATIDVMGRNHLRGVISKLSDINGTIEVKRL